MNFSHISFKLTLIAFFFFIFATAHANPGDTAAVIKARKDYEEAIQSKDIGRINAMKIELAVQLAKEQNQNESNIKRSQGNQQQKTQQ